MTSQKEIEHLSRIETILLVWLPCDIVRLIQALWFDCNVSCLKFMFQLYGKTSKIDGTFQYCIQMGDCLLVLHDNQRRTFISFRLNSSKKVVRRCIPLTAQLFAETEQYKVSYSLLKLSWSNNLSVDKKYKWKEWEINAKRWMEMFQHAKLAWTKKCPNHFSRMFYAFESTIFVHRKSTTTKE
jgi:hypothetical protein